MNQLVASLLLAFSIFPQSASAWCDNPETGTSKMFHVSIYTVSGCNPDDRFPEGTEIIEFAPLRQNNAVGSITQAVALNDECRWNKKRSSLSCSRTGRAPLAGATYVTTKDMQDICDETGRSVVNRLTCIRGCGGGRAPKYIEGSPWEC